MFEMFGGFSANKLKPQLKMAVSRFQIASNKKSALLKQSMREVAVLLSEEPPKEEKARIKAEALIRDDNLVEAYDILSLSCELLSERIKLIEFSKECPPDLVSVVATLIYASPRVDIPELIQIRKQFKAKYGKKFEEAALNNEGGVLNERVVTKLSVQPPAAYLVQTYLERICEQYEVSWSPTIKLTADQMCEPMAPPSGYSVQVAQGTGLGPVVAATGQVDTDEEANFVKQDIPTATAAYVEPSDEAPKAKQSDFDEPDIFIPPAPNSSNVKGPHSAGGKGDMPPPAPSAPNGTKINGSNSKNDGDDLPPAAPGASDNKASYNDLLSRFDNLKKL